MEALGSHDRPRQANSLPPWIGGVLVGLIVLGCCYASGIFYTIPPVRLWWSDRLDYVYGNVDLLVSSSWDPRQVLLSPDGRRVLIEWPRESAQRLSVWDLAADRRENINGEIERLAWLDPDHFVFIERGQYQIVDARDLSSAPVEHPARPTYLSKGGFARLESRFRAADQTFLLRQFDGSQYQFIIREAERWSVFDLGYGEGFGYGRPQFEAILADIPHIDIPEYGWGGATGDYQRVFSPDGLMYAAILSTDNRLAIYTRDGELLAETHKRRWEPYLLGWAHDSSGVYFRMAIGGGAGPLFFPERPLFKLAPYSPVEEWLLALDQALLWPELILTALGVVLASLRKVGVAPWNLLTRTRIVGGAAGLLAAGILGGSFWVVAHGRLPLGLTEVWGDWLADTAGSVERVVSTHDYPSDTWFAPSMRWVVVNECPPEQACMARLRDRETGVERTIPFALYMMRWLDDDRFVVFESDRFDPYTVTAFLVERQDLSITPFLRQPQGVWQVVGDLGQLERFQRDAEWIYAVPINNDNGEIGYQIFTRLPEGPIAFVLDGRRFSLSPERLRERIAQLPQVRLGAVESVRPIHKPGERLAAPDGTQYVQIELTEARAVRLVLYTSAGQAVAYASRAGWTPTIIGWSSDSAALYFSMSANTWPGMDARPYAYRPVFKMSATTPP